ncbi:TonB-dependent receptor domain-containing protein [Oleiharenicola lentus]|uniref:TonB-dependent receptor n=1 Tax=Oleiharenicola lentus TaxID=2508720 RepID=UPI003F661A2C
MNRSGSHQSANPRSPRFAPSKSKLVALLTLGSILVSLPLGAQTSSQIEAEIARLQKLLAETRSAEAIGTPVASASIASAQTLPVGQTAAQPPKEDALDLGKIVVRAETDLREVPKSVSVVTGYELKKFHVNNFRDIVKRIGNVRTSWQNPNTASIFVRGVGWAAGAGVLDPSVGVTVDGVSHGITSISALSNYSDIQSVDVTRGPNGIDGGKNSNVGRVSIRTKDASFVPEAFGDALFGQRNAVTGSATIGGPIIENELAYRISLHRETADGPFPNKNDTTYTWRNTDRTNLRAQFLWLPTDKLSARLSFDLTPTGREICENCFAFRLKTPAFYDRLDANGNRIAVDYAEDGFGKIQRRWFAQRADYTIDDYYAKETNTIAEYPNTYETRGVTLNLKSELSDNFTVSSISGWRDYEFSQGAGTHTPFDWLRAPRGTQTSFEQLSQEFRADWKINPALKYQGGVYFYEGRFPNYSQTERYGADGGAWYANAAQYAILDPVDPLLPNATSTSGWSLLKNATDGLITKRAEKLNNTSLAAYSNLTWKISERLALTAGLRLTQEERKTSGYSKIAQDGFAPELNPASVNNVQLNGFSSNAAGALTGTNSATQLALADFVAQKYFGVATYGGLTAAQRAQVGAAKSIRAARIGSLYQQTDAEPFEEVLPNGEISATYKLNDQQTVFASWKHGEKAGISQLVGGTILGGKSVPVEKETTDAFEVGTRAFFLDRTFIVNATAFLQNIDNYIQPTFVYDEVQTQLNNNGLLAYVSTLGNVPKVQTKGIELDASYLGIPYTTLRISGAYTEAVYKDFKFAPRPGEQGGPGTPTAYWDATGKTLPGAPKFSGNVYADFTYPIGNNVIHTNVNYNFQSGYYTDTTLSRYSFTESYGLTDISIGFGRKDQRFDVSLVAKNVFNVDDSILLAWNSYKPGVPRWIGVIVNFKLF